MMEVPSRGPTGVRQTVNTGLDSDETLWHFRSAWNVAALNCLDAAHEPILSGYGAFLKKFHKPLTSANTALDKRFRANYSSRNAAVKAREAHMTQVYNYFALPPLRGSLCSVALSVANDYLASTPTDPGQFATVNLALFENAFEQFFTEYERYQVESAAWDSQYGARYGSSQPGYVAVHGAGSPSVATSLVATGSPQAVGAVVDETGATIPIVPAAEGAVTTPVVQPIPKDE